MQPSQMQTKKIEIRNKAEKQSIGRRGGEKMKERRGGLERNCPEPLANSYQKLSPLPFGLDR